MSSSLIPIYQKPQIGSHETIREAVAEAMIKHMSRKAYRHDLNFVVTFAIQSPNIIIATCFYGTNSPKVTCRMTFFRNSNMVKNAILYEEGQEETTRLFHFRTERRTHTFFYLIQKGNGVPGHFGMEKS